MSNKKKILVSLIITLMLLTITIVSNAASDGVITGETVKLREEPSMDGSLVTLLSVDNKVEVLGKDGEWYHIKYEDYEGYVYQDYVDVEGEVENETNDTNSTSNTSSENEVHLTKQQQIQLLNLRKHNQKKVKMNKVMKI